MPTHKTKFYELANLFKELESVSSSLKMIDLLSNFFKKISPEEAKITAYLLGGKIAPDYLNKEFGLAEKLVMRATALAGNLKLEEVQKKFNRIGDLGDVVFEIIKNQNGSGQSILDVFNDLNKIALSSGEGSQEEKIKLLAQLIQKSSNLEAKYIIRIVLGILRLGVGDMTFLYGISKALVGNKSAKKTLEHAYNIFSDLGEVAYEALKYGIKNLEKAETILGIPI